MTAVLFLILGGTILIAFLGIIRRGALKGGKMSTMQFLVMAYGGGAALFGGFYVALWGFTLPELLPGFWTAVFCGTAANIVIQFLNAKAASLDKGEVSLTAPLQAMTPGIVTVTAFLFGEYPNTIGWIGIGLMVAGSYCLLWEKAPEHWYDYFGPLKRLRLLLRWRHLDVAERNKTLVVTMALGSACFGVIGLIFDGLYTRRGVGLQGVVLAVMVLTAILALTYLVWYAVRPDAKRDGSQRWANILRNKHFLWLAAFAVAWVGAILLIQPNYSEALIAYVGTLKRFSILFAVLMGYFFFHEQDFRKRLMATILVVCGAACIAADDLPARVTAHMEALGL